MSINVIFGSNVAGDSNYKRDNGSSNNLTDKTINRRNNTRKSYGYFKKFIQQKTKFIKDWRKSYGYFTKLI